MNIDIRIINNYVFAYSTMLRQLSAKYDDKTLEGSISELFQIYNRMSAEYENEEARDEDIASAFSKLRLCVMNLHISVLRNGYIELSAICDYLGQLVTNIECEIREA